MEVIFLFAPVSDVVLEGLGAAPDWREEFLDIYAHCGCLLLLLLLLLTPSPFAPLGLGVGAWALAWAGGPRACRFVLGACESFAAGLEVSAFRGLSFSARLYSLLLC